VNPAREAFYGWLIGNKVEEGKLPLLVQAFEAFKRGVGVGEVPAVDFRLLSGLPLKREHWMVITERMGWTATRMNLNTLARHGVFRPATRAEAMAEVTGRSGMTLTERVAARLRNPELIEKARAFPYQILIAHRMASDAVPVEIKEALQDALEIAVDRTPAIEGKVVVLPDVSGSMGSPVTGFRQGATTAVSCREVAALVTAAVLRRNPRALVLPFDNRLWRSGVNGRDSLATNTARLAALGGGGTDCSLPLRFMNQHKAEVDLVLMISDNQSWIDNRRQGATEVMAQWEALKQRNPQARLACLDLQPYDVTVASERDDILNIGGISDAVFEVIAKFARYELDPGHWVKEVEGIEL
ncbi:MAG: vWA domain-containing protein, partial [Nevskiales bacterium]